MAHVSPGDANRCFLKSRIPDLQVGGEGSLLTSRLLPFKSIATIAIPHPGLKPGIRDLRKARPAPPSCPPLQFLRPRLCYPAQIAARISAAEALSPKVSLTCTNRSTLPRAKTKLPPS